VEVVAAAKRPRRTATWSLAYRFPKPLRQQLVDSTPLVLGNVRCLDGRFQRGLELLPHGRKGGGAFGSDAR